MLKQGRAMNNDKVECPARPVVDFDHESSWHAQNAVQEYKKMRETCPMAWTNKNSGYWVTTRYEDIVAIAQRKEEFTPARIVDPVTGEERGGVTIPPVPFRVAPNETDLPEWQGVRGFLNRHFSPKAIEVRRPRARKFAAALIDDVIEYGRFDIVEALATPLPALMTMEIVGFPL
jgi:cytochrome P450